MVTRKRPPSARQVELARTDIRLLRARQTADTPYMNWRNDAKCRDEDPDLFFPFDADPVAKPLRICAECPVRSWCLADALESKDQFGIRGGTTEDERRPMFIAWSTKPGDPLPDDVEEVKPEPKPKPEPSTTCRRGHEKAGRDKNGTPYCLTCKAAAVAKTRGRSHGRLKITCGTVIGAEVHYRRGEAVCGQCSTAATSAGLQVPA